MRTIFLLFALMFNASLFGQGFDQEVIVDAEKGSLTKLYLPEFSGDTRWVVEDVPVNDWHVDESSKTLYLVPRSNIDVLLVVYSDSDQRILIYRYIIRVGGSPEPEPEPEPTPVDEFDGDDTYGLGKLSYEVSRPINEEARAKFNTVLTIAAKRLQGIGGILFVNRDLFEYLSNNSDPWTKPILDELESRKTDPLKLKDWLNMLEEIKNGIN